LLFDLLCDHQLLDVSFIAELVITLGISGGQRTVITPNIHGVSSSHATAIMYAPLSLALDFGSRNHKIVVIPPIPACRGTGEERNE
jgi:hypothetical protein